MPLDLWMPSYDARSSHSMAIRAEPAAVYQTLLRTNFGRNPVVVALMALRAVPTLFFSPRQAFRRSGCADSPPAPGPMGHLLSGHFVLLAEQPPTEIVFGLTGRFWAPMGGLVPTPPERFREPLPPGLARAVWAFHLQPVGPGWTRLSTETRVKCADVATRRVFLRYWRLIRGGSNLIRRALLRQVKHAAEHAAV